MQPKLIDTIPMTGSDGRPWSIEKWETYRLIPPDMWNANGKWVPDTFPLLQTQNGDPVDCEDEQNQIFRIRGTGITLRPI
jgi:hypothetical protein